MCDPISIAGFALSSASAVMGYQAQKTQANAQTNMYAQNVVAARQAFVDTNAALNVQEEQQQAAASQKRQENDLATRAAQATALAGAAAGGVQGISVEEILGDFSAKDARANSAINEQEGWGIQQAQLEKKGATAQMVSRMNSMTPGVQPTFADAALRIG